MALLVGYLIGISHVDPLKWNPTLDIDLGFPRGLREELIKRVHEYFGRNHAVLAGAISTYSVKGVIQDLGKALGLPQDDLRALAKQLHSHDARDLAAEMSQLMNAPRGLSQHVGGMILSSSPIPELVPVRAAAIDGR